MMIIPYCDHCTHTCYVKCFEVLLGKRLCPMHLMWVTVCCGQHCPRLRRSGSTPPYVDGAGPSSHALLSLSLMLLMSCSGGLRRITVPGMGASLQTLSHLVLGSCPNGVLWRLSWYSKATSIVSGSEGGMADQEGQLVGAFTWSPADPLVG